MMNDELASPSFSGGKLRILGKFGDYAMAVLNKRFNVHSKTKNQCQSNGSNVKN
jgi:hypothetical protein